MSALKSRQVFGARDGWMALGPELGSGGQAVVYPARPLGGWFSRENRAVAVFLDGAMPEHLEFFLDSVERATEGIEGIVKLHGPVRHQPNGEVVGYAMDRVRGTLLSEAKFRTTGQRLRFALALAQVVSDLLDRGLLLSDGKPDNVFVGPNGKPTLIDILSLSFPRPLIWPNGTASPHQFPFGTEEWSAPELLGQADPLHDERTVAYSLALNIHQTLKDAHPAEVITLDGRPVDLTTQLRGGGFGRYAPLSSRLLPMDRGIPHGKLPADIRYLFDLAFRCGRAAPDQRPTAAMWIEALERWRQYRRKVVAVAGFAITAAVATYAVRTPEMLPSIPMPRSTPTPSNSTLTGPRDPSEDDRPSLWMALQQR